ncbi:MAG: hypothetical protein D8M59_07995 [Planctomycetes bacterium]|nr:hypothetical protein [Planctomycetota bacterium]NOG53265.1 hypothetical protein [Planctomycetota bacterium]
MDDNKSNSLQDAIDSLADQFLNQDHHVTPASQSVGDRGLDASPPDAHTQHRWDAHIAATPAAAHLNASQHSDGAAGLSFDVLLIGHLPVLAGAWVATAVQYLTDHTTSDKRRLAFMSAENERVARLDLCTPLRTDQPAPDLGIDNNGDGAAAGLRTLRQSVETLRPETDRWLVQLAGPDDVIALSPTLNIRRIILLTGADQAAIVAAYRLLKRMAMLAGTETRLPQLALLTAGCNQSRAEEAIQRLSNTVSAFLDQNVELVGTIEAIRSTRIRSLSRFEMHGDFTTWLTTDLARMEPLEVTVRPDSLSTRLNTNGHSHPPPVPPKANGHPPSTPQHGRIVVENAPSLRRSTKREPLCTLIAGLQPLPVTCPYATGIEFAVDQTGLIHVLTLDSAHDDSPAIERLLVAGDWARDHATLLGLLDTRLSQTEPKVVRHLLMTKLGRRRHLLADSHIRCHLLMTPEQTGGPRCVAVPLF